MELFLQQIVNGLVIGSAYAVVALGFTETEPEVNFSVEKPLPVQDVALVEDQESTEDWPDVMEAGLGERVAVDSGRVCANAALEQNPSHSAAPAAARRCRFIAVSLL